MMLDLGRKKGEMVGRIPEGFWVLVMSYFLTSSIVSLLNTSVPTVPTTVPDS